MSRFPFHQKKKGQVRSGRVRSGQVKERKEKRMVKFLQINLGRRRAAHDLARKEIDLENVDVILVSEPNKKLTATSEWMTDKEGDAAMLCVNKDIGVQVCKSGVRYVRCELEKFTIYSCYISPNITLELFKKRLDAIMMDVIIASKVSKQRSNSDR